MHLGSAYRSTLLSALPALVWGGLLLTGCSSDSDTEARAEGSSSDNSATADDESTEDGAEPPLKPGTKYPTVGAAKDAGSASTSAAPVPVTPQGAVSGAPVPPSIVLPDAPAKPPVAEAVNPFVDTTKDAFSTFGADVDTASYDYLRQSLQTYAELPKPAFVRVEDYVNYFDYAYTKPAADAAQPFAISLAASAHPLGRSTTLVRVGIQAKAAPAVETRPANLVFLVDVSGSMSSADKLPLVQRVLNESLDTLAPTDKISIVTYAGDTRVRLAPTPVSSREAITQVVNLLQAGGSTAGASGINLAYEQASAGFIQGGINHVVLCTDGDFNIGISSDEALVALIKEKRATGVTLTALGFGRGNLNDSMMEKVSNAGNGSYSIVYSEDQAIEYANERLLSTIVHVAKDVKIQVEFNPAEVVAYRLVGYEDRAVADTDFRNDKVDGGEIGAEHRVTALYEVVLKGGTVPTAAGIPALSVGEVSDTVHEVDPSELVRVKVRSKLVTATDSDAATEVVASLKPADVLAAADQDLSWAAAVASFAEILRQSPYVGPTELAKVEELVTLQKDRDSDRGEFVQLVAKARSMLGK